MADFEGFREGCPGEVQIGDPRDISTLVHFEADGEKLTTDDAGVITPDAIRIVGAEFDGYMTFDFVAAEAQVEREDPRTPFKSIRLLYDDQIERLNNACGSCNRAESEPCPILSAAASEYKKTTPPMTFKEAYLEELGFFLNQFGDPEAAFFQIHRPSPAQLSDEELREVLDEVRKAGYMASMEPLEHEGETVQGIKINGGQWHAQQN